MTLHVQVANNGTLPVPVEILVCRTGHSSPRGKGGAAEAAAAAGATSTEHSTMRLPPPPLPRPAIGPQIDSERRGSEKFSFGSTRRSCVPGEPSTSTAGREPAKKPDRMSALASKGQRRSVRLPRALNPVDKITQAELMNENSKEAEEEAAKVPEMVAAAASQQAEAASIKSRWDPMRLKGKLLGAFADAAQREREPTIVATPAEISELMAAVSEHVDELITTLSDWDSDYRGDGTVSKRDFRRALPLLSVKSDRHVADALFESILPPPEGEGEGGEGAGEGGLVNSRKERVMEIWVLDRGIRWGAGSKAKRSKLLQHAGLFQDSSRSVSEQLRDGLVNNAMRVMDLFREWDVNNDGVVSKDEFRRAIPMLGLHAHGDQIDDLFAEFDIDHGGTISFRELNKLLRRDVKAEVKKVVKAQEEVLQIADVDALRRDIRHGLLSFSNTEVVVEDPLTGEKISSHTAG